MMGITNAFSSLGINERAPNPPKKHTVSLPNLLTDSPQIFDDDPGDQPIDFSKKYGETNNKPVKNYNFSMYAETDLDQPTDYSLRYAEDDSDIEECEKINNDTIKTYCTEDTPYETPFNFSTSTSMSDLREVKIDPEPKNPKKLPDKIKSSFSSGLMSPEKPINYCDEGTPGYFSRVDSCGSLNCQKSEPKDPQGKVKAVKFEPVVNYVEETPLMFSRSSSLASLDSIEGASIHDDRSSVVSDFSRLTSGVISPSELPDSPSQTVPPSPKLRTNPIVFPAQPPKTNDEMREGVPDGGVFGDVVTKFKMESTPLQFSTATSLSSLIDEQKENEPIKKEDLSEDEEDDDILAECINIGMKSNRYSQFNQGVEQGKPDITSDSVRTYCTEGTPAILSHAGSNSDLSILSLQGNDKTIDVIDNGKQDQDYGHTSGADFRGHETGEHDREDPGTSPKEEPAGRFINFNQPGTSLKQEAADDVDDAAPSNNSSHHSSFSSLSDVSSESEDALLQECILAGMPKSIEKPKVEQENEPSDDEDDDILADCINIGMTNNKYSKKRNDFNKFGDSVRSYCTEDTPAILSHAGSCSDISGLEELNSIFSDDDDDDDEGLLAECVRFGMAKITGQPLDRNGCMGRIYGEGASSTSIDKQPGTASKTDLNTLVEDNDSDTSSISSLSSSSDQALLQQCILAGMPKPPPQPSSASSKLTSSEKLLLQQIIVEGMKKCQISQKSQSDDSSAELTEAEQALLRQCILSGMPKNKNLTLGGPAKRESAELTEAERLLLQQCILAGMPKKKAVKTEKKVRRGEMEGVRRVEVETVRRVEVDPGHNCCIHCPRNKNNVKMKKKYREKEKFQIRESRDILYVTSQILAVRKDIVDGSREEWV